MVFNKLKSPFRFIYSRYKEPLFIIHLTSLTETTDNSINSCKGKMKVTHLKGFIQNIGNSQGFLFINEIKLKNTTKGKNANNKPLTTVIKDVYQYGLATGEQREMILKFSLCNQDWKTAEIIIEGWHSTPRDSLISYYTKFMLDKINMDGLDLKPGKKRWIRKRDMLKITWTRSKRDRRKKKLKMIEELIED